MSDNKSTGMSWDPKLYKSYKRVGWWHMPGIGWLIIARMWQEPTLVITNAFIVGAGAIGLLWNYLVA